MSAEIVDVTFTEQQLELLDRLAARRGVERRELATIALDELVSGLTGEDEKGTTAR